jgi:hypothetical protein
MAFFPLDPAMGGIIRGFPAAAHVQYASPEIPRRDAALPSEKNSHL